MMEKMENIVFDRNYEEDEPDPLAQAIFDRVNAPGGFLEEFSKKMDAIPKVIVLKLVRRVCKASSRQNSWCR